MLITADNLLKDTELNNLLELCNKFDNQLFQTYRFYKNNE
jgi:hypothetical protein